MNTASLFKLSSNLVLTYASDFRKYQQSVHHHLRGQLDDGQALLPSYLPPASYWSSEEKDLFFHGLAIYSRLRPDLIAADIRTKNTLDVRLYLDCLQTAASRVSDEVASGYTEPAMELSEDWISRENMLAEALNSLESCSWSAGKDGVYAQSKCICPSCEADISASPTPTDAYFNHLDSICLMTQEGILREAEAKAFDLCFSIKIPAAEENPKIAGSFTLISNHDTQDDVQRPSQENITSPMPERSSKDVLDIENGSASDKKFQRLLKKRLYMRRKRAELSGKDNFPDAIKLRPGRPRKFRKPSKPRPKNYNTKRKIASESSSRTQSLDPEVISSLPSSLLQPNSIGGMDEEDIESMYETHSQGGLTRHYRVKKFFQENGINAQVLSDMGVDLFHLTTLTRLMRLYNSMNDPEGPLDSVSIAAQTIQLLVDITKEFVSEVVRRAVIAKEQEIRLKRTMKVWKYERDEITKENVAECLDSLGLGRLDKEHYLSPLFEDQERDALLSVSSLHADTNNVEKEDQEPIDNLSKDQFYRTSQFTLPEAMVWGSLPNYCGLYPKNDIIWDQINTQELEKELDDDEELNAKDMRASEEYEASLTKTGR